MKSTANYLTTEERSYAAKIAHRQKKYLLAPHGERLKRLAVLREMTTQELRREMH
jgi:hypothetical protein